MYLGMHTHTRLQQKDFNRIIAGILLLSRS